MKHILPKRRKRQNPKKELSHNPSLSFKNFPPTYMHTHAHSHLQLACPAGAERWSEIEPGKKTKYQKLLPFKITYTNILRMTQMVSDMPRPWLHLERASWLRLGKRLVMVWKKQSWLLVTENSLMLLQLTTQHNLLAKRFLWPKYKARQIHLSVDVYCYFSDEDGHMVHMEYFSDRTPASTVRDLLICAHISDLFRMCAVNPY